MTIESWLPSLLGYLIPTGLFMLAWGGMPPARARRSTAVGGLALALGTLGYFTVGFAFHLGGAGLMSDQPGLGGLTRVFAGEGGGRWGLVGMAGFFLTGDEATPEVYALFFIYLPLVISTVLLTVLSLSDRAPGWQMVTGGLLVGGGLFPLAACWAWGGGWLANLGSTLERGHGFVDYSGSAVVYVLSGFAALGALTGLSRSSKCGSADDARANSAAEMPPSHFPLLANLGSLLFGLGWLGWSLSSPFHALGAELNVPHIAINGLLAGAGSIIASQTYCWFTTGSADALMSARGMAAGFVAISAGAPFVPPWAALTIGAVAGLLLPLGVFLVDEILRLPDATATVALGITAGTWGLLAVALFSSGRYGQGWNGVGVTEYHTVLGQGVTGFLPASGFIGDGRGQLIAQLAGLGAIAIPAWLVSWLTFLIMSLPYRRLGIEKKRGRTRWLRSLIRRGSTTETETETKAEGEVS